MPTPKIMLPPSTGNPSRVNRAIERADAGANMALDAATPTIYGCAPLFDLEAEDALMSLSFQADPFLDWLGWTATNQCYIRKYFLNFVRPKYANGSPSTGALANPCADPNTFEWDTCDFTLEDFARLRRGSPVRDLTKLDIQYTWNQPRYRLDGTVVNNDREFDIRMAMEVMLQDLRAMVIGGNSATPGEFDGLGQLIKYGYANSNGTVCKMMDSIVVDWNGNSMAGGSGVTWNGVAVDSGFSFIDVVLDIYRKIRKRIRMAPAINSQQLVPGDMVLVIPEDFANSILNQFTCWTVCNNDITQLQSYEARAFRDKLNGGKFGMGTITLDGFEVPLMPFDYGTINSVNNFDAYFLTGQSGNVKLLHGQYNDMGGAPKIAPDRYSIDGGRFLTWDEYVHTCSQNFIEMQPRLLDWAPWAQARISDISATVPGGIISSDPTSEYFPY